MTPTPSIQVDAEIPARFDSFGLHPDVQKAVAELGYETATPIQSKAIPVILAGQDVMGAAQTGTGKTAAFTLPMIERLLPHANSSASPARHPTRALVLTPTRELADQVAENAFNYAKYTSLRTAVVFGGVDIAPQSAQLRGGVEILIATPGRLLDHIQQKTANLSQVQMLVLDEADRMLDMGFLPDLQRILNLLPAQRQTLLFSATFSPEIKKLAATYLKNPVTIEVARGNATADTVNQVMHAIPDEHKRAAIVHILASREAQGLSRQCIIFSNSKLTCSRLSNALEKEGVKAGAIHGDKSQSERMQTLEAFKNGTIEALVATDVAARGLDIPAMPCVINFDLPYNAEDYVHRIGRTGRAGSKGDAISFVTNKDEKLLVDIEKLIKRKLPKVALEGFDPTPTWSRDDQRAGRWGEEGGRRGRWRDDASGRTETHGAHRIPKVAEDPFFSRPYEPSLPVKSELEVKASAPSMGGKAPRKQVGALLGGIKK